VITAAGLLLLAVLALIIAAIVRALLVRGIQITYIAAMSPEAEERMLAIVQAAAVPLGAGAATYLALSASPLTVPLQLLVTLTVGAVVAVLAARRWLSHQREGESPGRHKRSG
jgi:CBS-domain-containing membrane protein